MKKHIRRNVEVSAIQLTVENKDDVLSWAQSIDDRSVADGGSIMIITDQGQTAVNPGDYLMELPFPSEGLYLDVCDAEGFEKTYDAA